MEWAGLAVVLATHARFNIVVAVASSGIAAILLEGWRMAHSALKLPLNFSRICLFNASKEEQSSLGQLVGYKNTIPFRLLNCGIPKREEK